MSKDKALGGNLGKHTATPPYHYLEVQRKNGLIGFEIRAKDESVICEIDAKPYLVHVKEANAEFIVRACNSHEELLEACKQALSVYKKESYNTASLEQAISKAEGK